MKKLLNLFLLLILPALAIGQESKIQERELSLTNFANRDSLETILPQLNEDTLKAMVLSDLAYAYAFSEADKGLDFGKTGLTLSQKIGYQYGIANNMLAMCTALWSLGSYDNALQYGLDAMHRFEILKNDERVGMSYVMLSITYRDAGDFEKALMNARKSLEVFQAIGFSARISYANLGSIYDLQNQLDSALYYTQKAHEIDLKSNGGKWDWIYWIFGNIETKKHNYPRALAYYRRALLLAEQTNILKTIVEAHNGIAQVYIETGNLDSAVYYASEVLQKWQSVSYEKGVLEAAKILSRAYKSKRETDSAIKYLEFSIALNDRLFNREQVRNIQNLAFNEQIREDEIERSRKQYLDKLKLYSLIAVGACLFIIALVLWRNNLHRKRAYDQLQKQKTETEFQKDMAETALRKLQATQKQLIQSEKMASLGELTAGIAHEIQNPLNFVNNFSEVNKELLAEMKDEMDKGNFNDAKAIANDVIDNEEKINHHGKRADSIVKGMLQHSRSSNGQKEPTDINALADEYLRLAYHGLRAKDKSFNATMKTDFDKSIAHINIISQDIGRVLLNLITNAFYVVSEKAKQGMAGYQPTVEVSTKKERNKVVIAVKDNGNGIPAIIRDKIFQPFFTTKPTGQGTGLGLSLAYDIVKAHGGELKVDTKEGEGSSFFIILSP